MLPPVAVIGNEYSIAGEPLGCVSVMLSGIGLGSVKLIDENCSVRLGDGLLAVTVTVPVKAAFCVKANRKEVASPASIARPVGSTFISKPWIACPELGFTINDETFT